MAVINQLGLDSDKIKLEITEVTVEYTYDYITSTEVKAYYEDGMINTSCVASSKVEQIAIIEALNKLCEKVKLLKLYNNIPSENISRSQKYID